MIDCVDSSAVDVMLDSLSNKIIFFQILGFNESISIDSLQRRIFLDELIGKVNDQPFKPLAREHKNVIIPE
jgi:hypothetical protein